MCEARHSEHKCVGKWGCKKRFMVLHDFIPCSDNQAKDAIRRLGPLDTPQAAVERLGQTFVVCAKYEVSSL